MSAFAYSYDAVGYFHMPGYLSKDRVKDLAESLDLSGWGESELDQTRRIGDLVRRCEVARSLAEEIFSADWLSTVMTYPHRMIESYALERCMGGWLPFHGGAVEHLGRGGHPFSEDISTAYWVRSKRMYSMRVKALVYLDPIMEEQDGPLLYIEGSHKANYNFMEAFSDGPNSLEGYSHLIRQINVGQGDLVLLNEALVHGTRTKTSPKRRRVAVYTFAPSFVCDWLELEPENNNIERSGYAKVDTEDGHY